MRRHTVASILTLVLAAFALPATAQQFINILTGGTSGIYYPLGVGLERIYSKALPGAKITVQATKASVENLNLLQAGRGEVALTLGDALSQAWEGNKDAGYKQSLQNLRGISAMHSNYVQIVARKDSGIRTLADIKGKRVSVGAPKSGTELNARAVFAAAGMKYSDFAKVEYLPYKQSAELLQNRQIDVTLQSAGLGSPALRDLANSVEIVIIPIPHKIIVAIGDKAYQDGIVPANTYKGQTTDVPVARIDNFLVTQKNVSTDTVYRMTKAMFEHLDELVAAHAAAKNIKLDRAIAGMPIPLHPGAEKYYREVGLIKEK